MFLSHLRLVYNQRAIPPPSTRLGFSVSPRFYLDHRAPVAGIATTSPPEKEKKRRITVTEMAPKENPIAHEAEEDIPGDEEPIQGDEKPEEDEDELVSGKALEEDEKEDSKDKSRTAHHVISPAIPFLFKYVRFSNGKDSANEGSLPSSKMGAVGTTTLGAMRPKIPVMYVFPVFPDIRARADLGVEGLRRVIRFDFRMGRRFVTILLSRSTLIWMCAPTFISMKWERI